MSDSTTEQKLYFIVVDTLERLDIQFVPPELNIQRHSDTQAVKIVGKNNPNYQYTAGEEILSFDLDFYSVREDRGDVKEKCDWLKSLTYNEGYASPPELVKLVYGRLFRDELWTVKHVDYRLTNFNKQQGFMPQQAWMKITMALDEETLRSDLR